MAKNYLDKTGLTYLWGKLKTILNAKQDTLVSGTNIKTINGNSVLGSGDISISSSNSQNSYSTSTTDPYSANYVNGLNTYSTTEQRIGTWVDNKPLYRKVINITSGLSNFGNPYDIDISSLNTDYLEIENFQFEYILNNIKYSMQNSSYINGDDFIRIFRRGEVIRISSGSIQVNSTNKKLTFILKYTKTTD